MKQKVFDKIQVIPDKTLSQLKIERVFPNELSASTKNKNKQTQTIKILVGNEKRPAYFA